MKELVIAMLVLLVNEGTVSPGQCQNQNDNQPQAQRQPTGTGRLLKVPRIYNALITTDEELIPSQAYPAVAPVLRPAIPHFGTFLVYNESDYAGPDYPAPPPAVVPQPSQAIGPGQGQSQSRQEPPIYTLEAQQRVPNIFDDRVKNNRNPDIPDVPPPPLPVKPQQLTQPRKPSNDQSQQDAPQRPEPATQQYPSAPPLPFF